VAITPAAGFVTPMSALWIGALAGVFCYFMVVKVKAAFGYDDSLDAFGVHGAGGTLGALLTGVFANSAINPIFGAGKATGLLEGNGRQLLNQAVGVGVAWSLSIVGTLVILFVVDKAMGLRVSEDAEREGLDLSQHGEEGYDWAH
jgi:Amt family ammonium transporter